MWACLPTSRSYAAGFRPSSEPSSLSGVRHFWQYMAAGRAHPWAWEVGRIRGCLECGLELESDAPGDAFKLVDWCFVRISHGRAWSLPKSTSLPHKVPLQVWSPLHMNSIPEPWRSTLATQDDPCPAACPV